MFDPDTFNGDFVMVPCRRCRQEWECYRTDPDFVCDDCLDDMPEPDLDDGARRPDWE